MSTRPAAAQAPAAPPSFVAVVTARHSNVVIADFDGRVLKLNVHSGEHVKAGQVIAELDDTDLKVKIADAASGEESASAEAGASGAAAGEAAHQANLQVRLANLGAASANAASADRAKAAEEGGRSAAASIRAKGYKAKRDDLKAKLAHAKVTAPMDGVVSGMKMKEGEMAHSGSPLARIFDQHDLLVRFAVPRANRKLLKKGMRVEVDLAGADRPIYATVESISEEMEPPINYTMVDADIDDSKLAPDEVRVASTGHVRLADAGGKR